MERDLRPVVVGRKNWMFTGSIDGGRNAALPFSIVNSCKLNKIDPFTYLKDVIPKLVAGVPAEELTTYRWKQTKSV